MTQISSSRCIITLVGEWLGSRLVGRDRACPHGMDPNTELPHNPGEQMRGLQSTHRKLLEGEAFASPV